MKKLSLFLILINTCLFASGNENKSYSSIEIDAIYGYHFIVKEHHNFHNNYKNCGFSLFFPRHINKLKVSLGVNYYSRSYYYIPDYTTTLQRRNYNIQYLNLPMLIHLEVVSLKSVKLNILIGASFNSIFDYKTESVYPNKIVVNENNINIWNNLGLGLVQGITIVKPLNQKMNLNVSHFANTKLISETYVYDDVYFNEYPIYDRWSVGIKIGIEYIF